jgi:hypothetical protein
LRASRRLDLSLYVHDPTAFCLRVFWTVEILTSGRSFYSRAGVNRHRTAA